MSWFLDRYFKNNAHTHRSKRKRTTRRLAHPEQLEPRTMLAAYALDPLDSLSDEFDDSVSTTPSSFRLPIESSTSAASPAAKSSPPVRQRKSQAPKQALPVNDWATPPLLETSPWSPRWI